MVPINLGRRNASFEDFALLSRPISPFSHLPGAPDSEAASQQRAHFDAAYRSVDADRLVSLVLEWRADAARLRSYLEHLTATHASWHGLYLGGLAARLPGKRVLELGSGDGTNACIMAVLGADVIACDVSGESARIVDQVVARTGLRNLRREARDAAMLCLPSRSMDFVVGKSFLHHLDHEAEAHLLDGVAALLRDTGEARFFEPAVNSRVLDRVRWMVPVPGRPSSLARKAFHEWHEEDAHPERDNSSAHYREAASALFRRIDIMPVGSLERFYRLLPRSRFQGAYRRWAHRSEQHHPEWLRWRAARAQLIVLRSPIRGSA